jgi:hypothetical protein
MEQLCEIDIYRNRYLLFRSVYSHRAMEPVEGQSFRERLQKSSVRVLLRFKRKELFGIVSELWAARLQSMPSPALGGVEMC